MPPAPRRGTLTATEESVAAVAGTAAEQCAAHAAQEEAMTETAPLPRPAGEGTSDRADAPEPGASAAARAAAALAAAVIADGGDAAVIGVAADH